MCLVINSLTSGKNTLFLRKRFFDVEADVLEPDLRAQLEAVQPLRDAAAVVPLDTKLKLTEHRIVGHGCVRADGVRPVEIVLAVRAPAPARCLEEDAGANGQREGLALGQAEGVDRRVVVVLALGDQRQIDELTFYRTGD